MRQSALPVPLRGVLALPGVRAAVLPIAVAAAGLTVPVLASSGLDPMAAGLAASSLVGLVVRLTLVVRESRR